jgi:hypothetical protein
MLMLHYVEGLRADHRMRPCFARVRMARLWKRALIPLIWGRWLSPSSPFSPSGGDARVTRVWGTVTAEPKSLKWRGIGKREAFHRRDETRFQKRTRAAVGAWMAALAPLQGVKEVLKTVACTTPCQNSAADPKKCGRPDLERGAAPAPRRRQGRFLSSHASTNRGNFLKTRAWSGCGRASGDCC